MTNSKAIVSNPLSRSLAFGEWSIYDEEPDIFISNCVELKKRTENLYDKAAKKERRTKDAIRSLWNHVLKKQRKEFQEYVVQLILSFNNFEELAQLAEEFYQSKGYHVSYNDSQYCAGLVWSSKVQNLLFLEKHEIPKRTRLVLSTRKEYTQSKLVDFCKLDGFPRQFWETFKEKIEQDEPDLGKYLEKLKMKVEN